MLLSVTMIEERFSAELLRGVREASGKTQEDVAWKLGVSSAGYRKWEYGQSKPRTENLIKLAGFFDVSPTAFLNDGENGEQDAA
jgi:transcriptional regulator with XRE-family HTH domain